MHAYSFIAAEHPDSAWWSKLKQWWCKYFDANILMQMFWCKYIDAYTLMQTFCHKYSDANIYDAGNNAAKDPESAKGGTSQWWSKMGKNDVANILS